ncbi:MAG TPA: ATP-binding protein [Anaerolineales bacterium]|nr:ATP-binding protein [Anaerolineales bacterium]
MDLPNPVQAGAVNTSDFQDSNLLKSVLVALSTKLDPDEILSSGCDVLQQYFQASQSFRWMPEVAGDEFTIYPGSPAYLNRNFDLDNFLSQSYLSCFTGRNGKLPAESYPWLQGEDVSSEVYPYPNLLADFRLRPYSSLFQVRGIASALLVPVKTQGGIYAVIELVFDRIQSFDETAILFCRSVASAIGSAIETVKHYQSLQNYAEFLDHALAQRTGELRSERDRTRAILDALGEAVVVTDLNWKIQYANPAATALTGFSQEELLGQQLRLWRSTRQTAEFNTQVLNTTEGGRTWRGEVINLRKDGTLYDAALAVAPLFDPDKSDRSVGYVTVQRDISPIKAAENLKDQFISNVSHELRTPVSVITLLTDNLESLYDRLSDEKRKKLIGDIREHSQVLNDLISSVLEISRIDGGQVTRDYRRVNLADLITGEAEKQQPLAESKNQTLEAFGEAGLVVIGNEGQLRQVVRNLINNAIKYSMAEAEITLEWRALRGRFVTDGAWPGRKDLAEGSWAGFRVSDKGIGISEEHLPHLFERFYRVEAQGNIPGAGLGLSIARDLIKIHSGSMGVASEPGKGTTFTVFLPLLHEE